MSLGFAVIKQGSSGKIEAMRELRGAIRDEGVQKALLPLISTPEMVIDPYDGALIGYGELDAFIERVEAALRFVSGQDVTWPIGASRLNDYFRRCVVYGLGTQMPREQAVGDLERMLALARKAQQHNFGLAFYGD